MDNKLKVASMITGKHRIVKPKEINSTERIILVQSHSLTCTKTAELSCFFFLIDNRGVRISLRTP